MPGVGDPRSTRLVTWTLTVSAGLFLGYQVGAVIVPYYTAAERLGDLVAGLTTGVFMIAATVPPLVLAPALLRWGVGRWLVVSAVLLGPPTLMYLPWRSAWGVVTLSAVRGVGFGLAALATGAIVALLAGAGRQGGTLGLYGLVTSLTALVGQAGGLWFQHLAGFRATFVVVTALPLLAGLAVVPLLRAEPRIRASAGANVPVRARPTWTPLVLAPMWGFGCVAAIYGGLVTFAPGYLHARSSVVEVAFFVAVSTAVPTARLVAGVALDRGAPPRSMITAGLLLVAAGMVLLARPPVQGLAVVGGLLFGVGFGALATQAHVALVRSGDASRVPMATALFGGAWNAGMAVGGVVFGPVVGSVGAAAAFLLAPLLCVAAAVATPAWTVALRGRGAATPRGLSLARARNPLDDQGG
ncbi:MAG TPA: MFS transporter [Actinomycetes bacterium]|nr:MFS transporter [Actinomycetes bacterium]